MTNVLGLPLEDALQRLRAEGISPEILRSAGFRAAQDGRERVIRMSEDGRRLTVACFPDAAKRPEEGLDHGE